ncbi:MAG: transglycosylase domain-containing protein [Parcubacteria group bacterium]|nr:transglycosylase domain-containing protein [Parcubacteria group bacterium]
MYKWREKSKMISKFLHNHKFKKALMLVIALFLFVFGISLIWVSTLKIPTLETFEQRKISQSTKIYDRTGQVLLYDVSQNLKRSEVPFAEISQYAKDAALAIEDVDFYSHHGIKITSIIRAVFANIGGLSFNQGGSTITQQVVKNLILTGDKTITRKLKEWILALKLEKVLTKSQIFSLYLNEIPYGGNIYGIEEASQTFFSKKSNELTIAESAYLAALPQAPTYYSPYGNNKDKLDGRKNLVLHEMLGNGFITTEEYNLAKDEKVVFKPKEDRGIKAPHFVFFVKDLLERKYGADVIENGGLKVITTLDYSMEKIGEELAQKYALENETKYNAENVGLVAIDPKTGDILTMVGSRDYFDKGIDGNFNITTAHRQPGSAFKPFAYATAFSNGYTPETVLFDTETEFSTTCSPQGVPLFPSANCYNPRNYDNIFRGPTSMRNALAQSINIPSIKTLYLAGIKETLRLAKDMGITSLGDSNQYGLTLVLGGGEVSLLDITSAYSVFANNGKRNPYRAILEIEDNKGNVLEKQKETPTRQVIPENVALTISDVLNDETARTPAFGVHSFLYFQNRDVAVKTGTTNDYRDAWIVGYTPNIAVGAWAGNNDNSSMEKKVAGFIIAPFWNAFMSEVLKNLPDEKFQKPATGDTVNLKPILKGEWQGTTSYQIDKISGKRATQFTPIELIQDIVIGPIHNILYSVDKDNPRGDAPQNPQNDPQYNLWEYPAQQWLQRQGIVEKTIAYVPQGYDDIHGPQYAPQVNITNPIGNLGYNKEEKMNITVNTSGRFPILKIEYFINGNYIGNATSYPFYFSFIPNDFGAETGSNILKIFVYDNVLNKTEVSTTVNFTS